MTTTLPTTSLASQLGHLAHRLKHLGTGPLAELRRLRADADDRWRSATFYQVYGEISPDHAGSEAHERRWAMILAGMATLTHEHGPSLGRALAAAGFAERRLVRLLDADDDHLPSELRAVVSFLASKGSTLDWRDLAALVLSVDAEHRDAVRRRIAAAYFRNLSH
jgi:CRISPR type I-E-associated protein CasB/Cse2